MGRIPHSIEIGNRFGRLEITDGPIREMANNKTRRRFIAKCDCGNIIKVEGTNLIRGTTQSCGCLQIARAIQANFRHGLTKSHPLYGVWNSMKQRCSNRAADCYERYGQRGITVCDEWKTSFVSFYDWAIAAGWKRGMQIDRIDNNRIYEPSNCRFVTPTENGRNKRNNRLLTVFGETKPLSAWCDDPRCCVSIPLLRQRILRDKWDHTRAITTKAGA